MDGQATANAVSGAPSMLLPLSQLQPHACRQSAAAPAFATSPASSPPSSPATSALAALRRRPTRLLRAYIAAHSPARLSRIRSLRRPWFTPSSSVPRRTRCFFRAISSADSAFSAHASLSHRGTPDCLRTARSNDTVCLPSAPYLRTLSLTVRPVCGTFFSRQYCQPSCFSREFHARRPAETAAARCTRRAPPAESGRRAQEL
ncbi:hypothetical protein K466DRAFT_212352 [Polyporus arcularius HHB13444]|uniref:Uncharacterized protein n=1 Tax=Polyporus arcularius HHB13444 TaxID=1314778 RepID=A0A5C3PXM5_9APHY|nr:hypothetical protein K466DRAFT_212352 [Polyporus arcularius HHB13444]